jgi:hypothetical protein
MYFLLILLSLNFSNKSLDSITDIKNITVYPQEGQSIRALTVVSDSEIHFASDQGVYGKTLDSGENWDIQNVYFKENPIAFRSIAKTENNFFLLSIGTPALLYKISENTKELVYQEMKKLFFTMQYLLIKMELVLLLVIQIIMECVFSERKITETLGKELRTSIHPQA